MPAEVWLAEDNYVFEIIQWQLKIQNAAELKKKKKNNHMTNQEYNKYSYLSKSALPP